MNLKLREVKFRKVEDNCGAILFTLHPFPILITFETIRIPINSGITD